MVMDFFKSKLYPIRTLYFAVLRYNYLARVTCVLTMERWLIVAVLANKCWDLFKMADTSLEIFSWRNYLKSISLLKAGFH